MTRKEQAEASRAALIEAGRTCFTELGYEDTTVAEILARAGMARGALYHYFPGGKRELFGAVFDVMNEAFHHQRDALFAIDSPVDRIRAGIRVFLELCRKDDFARIVLKDAPSIIPGQGDLGSSYELLHAQLAEAVELGAVRPFDPDTMARALYGAVRSAGELVMAARNRRQAIDDAALALDLMIDGLLPERPGPSRAPGGRRAAVAAHAGRA